MKIAQRFSVGCGPNERTSPEGTAEMPGVFRRPFGTHLVSARGPNAEALGHSRMSLRDRDNRISLVLKSKRHYPSSGAAMRDAREDVGMIQSTQFLNIAAPEDGRTPPRPHWRTKA